MSRGVKILILVLTVLPILLYFGGYIGMVVSMMGSVASTIGETAHKGGTPDFAPPMAGMAMFFGCTAVAGLLGFGMFIFYLCNLIVTNRVPRDLRPVWGVLILVGFMVSWVVYWYNYIWREPAGASEVTTSIRPTSEGPATQDG